MSSVPPTRSVQVRRDDYPATAILHRHLGLVACILAISAVPAQPQAQGITGRRQRPTVVKTEPRSPVTAVFVVAKEGEKQRELESSVELPEGLRVLTGDGSFTIDPGNEELRIVSFLVPRSALSDLYVVSCSAADATDAIVSAPVTLSVAVLPKISLPVRTMDSPQHVVAGDSYMVFFSVANDGNTRIDVVLQAGNVRDAVVEILDSNTASLQPSETREVQVLVETDEGLSSLSPQQVTLTAAAADHDVTAKASSSVEVIPRSGTHVDPYRRIPMELAITHRAAMAGSWFASTAAKLVDKGTLDQEGIHHIEFSVEKQSTSRILDKLSATLGPEWYRVRIGDHSFSLSELTQSSTSGTGAETTFNYNDCGFLTTPMRSAQRWIGPPFIASCLRNCEIPDFIAHAIRMRVQSHT